MSMGQRHKRRRDRHRAVSVVFVLRSSAAPENACRERLRERPAEKPCRGRRGGAFGGDYSSRAARRYARPAFAVTMNFAARDGEIGRSSVFRRFDAARRLELLPMLARRGRRDVCISADHEGPPPGATTCSIAGWNEKALEGLTAGSCRRRSGRLGQPAPLPSNRARRPLPRRWWWWPEAPPPPRAVKTGDAFARKAFAQRRRLAKTPDRREFQGVRPRGCSRSAGKCYTLVRRARALVGGLECSTSRRPGLAPSIGKSSQGGAQRDRGKRPASARISRSAQAKFIVREGRRGRHRRQLYRSIPAKLLRGVLCGRRRAFSGRASRGVLGRGLSSHDNAKRPMRVAVFVYVAAHVDIAFIRQNTDVVPAPSRTSVSSSISTCSSRDGERRETIGRSRRSGAQNEIAQLIFEGVEGRRALIEEGKTSEARAAEPPHSRRRTSTSSCCRPSIPARVPMAAGEETRRESARSAPWELRLPSQGPHVELIRSTALVNWTARQVRRGRSYASWARADPELAVKRSRSERPSSAPHDGHPAVMVKERA